MKICFYKNSCDIFEIHVCNYSYSINCQTEFVESIDRSSTTERRLRGKDNFEGMATIKRRSRQTITVHTTTMLKRTIPRVVCNVNSDSSPPFVAFSPIMKSCFFFRRTRFFSLSFTCRRVNRSIKQWQKIEDFLFGTSACLQTWNRSTREQLTL